MIGVGAPWYTSGVQEWNGTAPILNNKPTETKTIPISKKMLLALPAAAPIPDSEIVPEYPYKNAAPNKKNAEE